MELKIEGYLDTMRLTFSKRRGCERLSVDQVVSMISALGRDDMKVEMHSIGSLLKQIVKGLNARGVNATYMPIPEESGKTRRAA